MNVYMTEEEQIEAIKKWWKKFGNAVLSSILVVMLLIVGVKWWKNKQVSMSIQASQHYQLLMSAQAKRDISAVKVTANYLKSTYASSVYAQSASLILAKVAVSEKRYSDAKGDLEWVANHSKSEVFKQVAYMRLARISLYLKQYKTAENELSKVTLDAFSSLVHESRGDIFSAQNLKSKAKKEYALAIKLAPSSRQNNYLLEMKIQALGLENKHVASNSGHRQVKLS